MIQFRDAIAKVRSGTHLGAKEVAELVNELLDGKASVTNEQTGLARSTSRSLPNPRLPPYSMA